MKSRRPWLKFFPTDHRADAGLRSCGYAARGLWMDMLTLMHEADSYGSLLINGLIPSMGQLAAMLGGTEKQVAALVAELEAAGVFSREKDGTIYNRRMKRDSGRAEVDTHWGNSGGNPDLERGSVPKEERVRPFRRSDAPAKTQRIFQKKSGKCWWCEGVLDPSDFRVDHLILVKDGGTNDDENLVPSCTSCDHKRVRPPPDDNVGGNSDLNVGAGTDTNPYMLEARSYKKEGELRSPTGGRAGEPPGFAEFWAEYPKKDDKGHARQAFRTACRKASPGEILLGLRRYQFNGEARYWPLAAKWLRGERWRCETDTEPENVRDDSRNRQSKLGYLDRFAVRLPRETMS